MASLITAEEYRLFIGEDLTAYDAASVAAMLDAISTDVENYVGVSFSPQTHLNQRVTARTSRRSGEAVFQLPGAPIISVNALGLTSLGQQFPLLVEFMSLDTNSGVVSVPVGTDLFLSPGVLVGYASYISGYAVVPSPVKWAVALLMKEALQVQNKLIAGEDINTMQLASFRTGDYSETYRSLRSASSLEAGSALGLGTPLSGLAIQKLDKYRRSGVVIA